MNILAPSILSADFKNLAADIDAVARGGAEYIHIDVMDGVFVPNISFGMPVIKSIRSATDKVFDVHLMITEPIRYIEDFKNCGADIITVHYEACSNVRAALEKIKSSGLRAGLSVKPKTDVNVISSFLDVCDMILLMSVEPGFGGQKFIPGSLERAARVRNMIDSSPYDIDLEIDGGVTLDNLEDILSAGVNVIVAGSSIFKSPQDNTVKFMEIMENHDRK